VDGWRNLTRDNRLAMLLALVLVLGVRAIVPQGYMPDTDAGAATLSVKVCNAAGADLRIEIPLKDSEPPQSDDASGELYCDFASLAQAALGTDAGIWVPEPPVFTVDPDAEIDAPAIAPIERLRPPLRAPPLTA